MENASKALIIAGAILLSILIISLGIAIFGQASGVLNNNAMSEVEISAFNSKFTQYEGPSVRGAQVNSLLNQIVNNNITNESDESKKVKVTVPTDKDNWSLGKDFNNGNAPTSISQTGKALTGRVYTVSCTPNANTGLIESIKIELKGSGS